METVHLLNRYARAVDTQDWALLIACFTPDATADLPLTGHHEGSSDIVSAIRGLISRVDATQHLVTNHTVEATDGELTSTSYFQAHHRKGPIQGGRVFTSAGTYTDRLRIFEGEWRIAHRTLTRTWTAGDESVLARG